MNTAEFEGILAGMKDVAAIAQGVADPASYRVHRPKDADHIADAGKMPTQEELSAGRVIARFE